MPPLHADNESGSLRASPPARGIGGAVADSRSASSLMMEETRESELVQASQKGDREAYRELIRQYERPVYRLAYALTRDHEEASALAVETFARGLAEIGRLPEGKRFFPWLLRFARNLSVTRARRRAEAEATAGTPKPAGAAVELEQ